MPISRARCRAEEAIGEALPVEWRALATRGVMDMERKLKIEKETLRTMVATAVPASAAGPSRPTKAVSMRERSGSRAREPMAGRASMNISVSTGVRRAMGLRNWRAEARVGRRGGVGGGVVVRGTWR